MAPAKVIAVMGVTGVGKSSFIKLVTGDETIKVGDTLESETAEVNTYKFRHKDRTIILVDTPGFDDTHKKDADVLKLLASWFESTYKSGMKLSGIIYLHRITDDRMRGSSLRSMRMFRQLCGESFYQNLLLGTTCWSLISEEVGSKREKELMTDENFWKGLIGKGAQFVRMPDDGFEAKEMVYDLARLEPVSLQIQKEMVDGNVQFGALSATQTLDDGLSILQSEHASNKQQLEADHQRKLEEQKQREEQLRIQMEQERYKALLAERLRVEHGAIESSRAKFTEGIQNNTFLAKLHPLALAFSTTCDNCCKWVGQQQYYMCTSCNEANFVLCGECYRSGAAFCYDQSHHASMRMMAANDGPPQCRHIRFPTPSEAHFACYRCANNIEGVFVHCCSCLDDSFNMCLECLTNLGTCKKSWSLSGHRLYPMIRRCRYQPTSNINSDDMSKSLFDLAGKFKEQDKWSEAENAYLQVLSRREKEHGMEDQLVRDSYYHLGLVYLELDRLQEAADRFEAALNGEEKAYGSDDNRTLYTAFKLAQAYKRQKMNDKAIVMYNRAIGRETGLGAGDIAVRISRYDLAIIYEDRDQLAEASSLLEATLKGEEEALGHEHEDTLMTVSRLAGVYKQLRRFDDSERAYNRVLAGREKSLGPGHKNVIDTYYNLGLMHKLSGNLFSAEANFSRAVAGYEKLFEPNHSEVLDAIDKRVEVLMLDSRFEPAVDLCRTTLQRRRESHGPQHADTQKNEKKLAEVTENLRAAKFSAISHSPTFDLHGSTQSMQQNSHLDASITQLIAALPQIPTEQQSVSWDQEQLQMALSGNIGLESTDVEGRTALLYAVEQNSDQNVIYLLNRGANLGAKDNRGRTALHLALQNGNGSLTTLLLDWGLSAMERDAKGSIPLHYAAVSGQTDCMSKLLACGGPAMDRFDIEAKNQNGYTALQLASLNGRHPAVQLLMSHGASYYTMSGPRGMNAAHMAAEKGHTDILRVFTQWGLKVDALSATSMTALHHAAAHGHAETVSFLLERGAQIDAKCESSGWSPLFYAACHGHEAAAQVLIEKGADVHAEAAGFPLIHTLAFNDTAEGLHVLFQNGVDVETQDRIGNTPLLYAVRAKTFEALQLLLEIGANPEAKENQNGGTSLSYAASNGQDIAVQLLISFGAYIDATDSLGYTPLHQAVINGQEECVRLLLDSGANTRAKNKDAQTPLQLAAMHNQSAIMSMLILRDSS